MKVGLKKLSRFLLILSFAVFLSGILCVSASAKSDTPKKVSKITVSAGESSIKLSWNKVSNADGYVIYMRQAGGSYVRLGSTRSRSYTVKKLDVNTTYYFRIRTYRSVGGKKYYSDYSKTVKGTPKVKTPSKPSGLKVSKTGNKQVTLKWSKASNAQSYQIYRYDSSKKKYVKVATTKKLTYTVTGLKNGTTYKFKVRSCRTVSGVTKYSKFTSAVTGKPFSASSYVSTVHPMYFKATVKKTVTASPANSSSKKQKVKKGTTVTVLSRGSTCKVKLSSGQQVYIKLSNLNFTKALYTTKNYSNTLKEDFVNSQNYSSSTKWLIWVSTYTQTFSLYTGSRGNWNLVRTDKFSTGKASNPTSVQVCKITRKEEGWYYDDGTYQKPIVYFYGDNAFHSRLHNSDGSITDSTIGKPATSGCVRMYDDDIYYIYKNCPVGTTVVIY